MNLQSKLLRIFLLFAVGSLLIELTGVVKAKVPLNYTPRLSTASTTDPVIVAAGDIACNQLGAKGRDHRGTADTCRMNATADLLVGQRFAAVLPLGDLQYPSGALTDFESFYDPSWGRMKAVSHPVVGNHEYLTSGADGYFSYFSAAAGDPNKGYYSYDIGLWHLIALNSNCHDVGGCGVGSPQEKWLKADLATHPAKCTLAYWHHPRFSSAIHGNNRAYDTFWQELYSANAEIILVAHDHDYERFAPQTTIGTADSIRGIREFVVGTGGKSLYPFLKVQPNSVVRNNDTYGILKLTLHSNSYDWQFIPVEGKTFLDSGTSMCH